MFTSVGSGICYISGIKYGMYVHISGINYGMYVHISGINYGMYVHISEILWNVCSHQWDKLRNLHVIFMRRAKNVGLGFSQINSPLSCNFPHSGYRLLEV